MAVERILDDPVRAATLIAAGGRLDRHSVVMVLDPTDAPPPPLLPPGFTIGSMDATCVADYGRVVSRAYPPEHLDHEPDDADPAVAADSLERYLRGEEIGPWISEASLHVTDASGRIVALILLNETAGTDAFDAGPFVTDLCVDPAARGNGIGGALIIEAADRLSSIGRTELILVVTVGNPARRVYERLGFRVTAESWRIDVD